jgi:UDP-N-acetylenolpyruvoylglucosamine reductase
LTNYLINNWIYFEDSQIQLNNESLIRNNMLDKITNLNTQFELLIDIIQKNSDDTNIFINSLDLTEDEINKARILEKNALVLQNAINGTTNSLVSLLKDVLEGIKRSSNLS